MTAAKFNPDCPPLPRAEMLYRSKSTPKTASSVARPADPRESDL